MALGTLRLALGKLRLALGRLLGRGGLAFNALLLAFLTGRSVRLSLLLLIDILRVRGHRHRADRGEYRQCSRLHERLADHPGHLSYP